MTTVYMTGRQAIVTKYLGPTNHTGGRVKASCDALSVTLPWDHSQDIGENHASACRALVAKLGWEGKWVGGSAPQKGSPHAYVFVDGVAR